MLRKTTIRTAPKPLALASMMLGVVAVASPAFADSYSYTAHTADPIDHEFRASHPFKVFVNIETQNRRGNDTATHIIRDQVSNMVPSYVVLVSDHRAADMILSADELNYQVSFHVTDVDQRNKKYKSKRRYTGGKCGIHQRAFYTRITEKGVALADYKLTARIRDGARYTNAVHIKADEKYRHGKNLRAQTNCGTIPTAHYPNSAVAKLFSRSVDEYRQAAAFEVHKETMQKLAHTIAKNISSRSDQFYASLASRYAYAPAYAEHRTRNSRVRAGMYDRDADAVYRRQ